MRRFSITALALAWLACLAPAAQAGDTHNCAYIDLTGGPSRPTVEFRSLHDVYVGTHLASARIWPEYCVRN